ncbi:DUF881 domain-containing protein, partial [Frankia sp. AiPs1]|nr:DUF881 domain-containing protein [Frankia sp. AiPs1]
MALALVLALLGGVIAIGARRAAVTADARDRLAVTLRAQVGERSMALARTEDRVGRLRSQLAMTRE